MIKQIIFLFNIISVIGFNFFFAEDVNIQVDAPASVQPGSEFTVEITVNKGDLDGFAKLQQSLPAGFTASKESTSNATFSFKDQQLKCIWMVLPTEESFTVRYLVKVDDNVNGVFNLEGSFAYIQNNEKQIAAIPNIKITVGEVVATTNEEPQEATKPTTPTAPVKAAAVKREMENGVLCMRTTSPVKGKSEEFKVEIKIQSDKSGFAKLEEYIPNGFTASEIESMEGMFSFKNNTVKIIWMSLPVQSEFNVAYKLVANETVSGNQKVEGAFAYIADNKTNKFTLTPSNIFIERDSEGLATIIIDDEGGTFAETPKVEIASNEFSIPKPEDDDPPVKSFTSEVPKEEVKEEEPVIEEPVAEVPVSKTPAPESDITYKVQIAAGHKSVSKDYFAKKFKFNNRVNIENHEGWIKYTTGGFKVYKEGRDHRNKIWDTNKITDAFVTAYNYGNRITVQEALMISNQKWYN